VQGSSLVPMLSCGAPAGLWYEEGVLYVCDISMQGVLRYEYANGSLTELVKEYEAKLFKGPSAIVIDKAGNVFFLDAGPLGETTLQSPKGSAFQITADAQLLQPLALECLAHPSALALGPSGIACDAQGNLYVCQYDLAAAASTGRVSVISSGGKLLREIEIPAPELTGIVINPEGSMLYVTEASTSSVYGVPL